jgi:hypothetical protein
MFREESYCTAKCAGARNVSSGVQAVFYRLIFQKKRGFDDWMDCCPQAKWRGGCFGSWNINLQNKRPVETTKFFYSFLAMVQYTQDHLFSGLGPPCDIRYRRQHFGKRNTSSDGPGFVNKMHDKYKDSHIISVNSAISLSQILIPAARTHTHTHTQPPVQ